MDGLGQFIALITGMLAIIGCLVRIAWTTGQLVQRFGDHVVQSDKTHDDQEKRIRNLEDRTRRFR